jgi:hypothetical protein
MTPDEKIIPEKQEKTTGELRTIREDIERSKKTNFDTQPLNPEVIHKIIKRLKDD